MKVYVLLKSGKSNSYYDVDYISSSCDFLTLYFFNGDVLTLALCDIQRFSVR